MTAQELKNSILMRAVSGKLVSQNPDDEPASVLLAKIRAEKEQMIKEGKIKKAPISEIYVDPSDNQHYEKVGNTVKCIEDEIPFEIPEGWAWCRLGNVLQKLTDGTHSTPKYVDKGVPFLSVKDISTGKIDFSETKYISKEEHDELYKRCNPEKGDILLTKVGTTGIPVIVDTDKEFSLFVSVALLKFDPHLINRKYLHLLLLSPLVQKQCTENTKGVGNKNWVMKDIANTLIAMPPYAEQEKIVIKVDPFNEKISIYAGYHKRIDLLNGEINAKLQKSLLQYAIQGKLVPQNPDDEPASVLLERIRAEKEQLIKDGKLKRSKNESYIYRGSDNSYYEKFADGREVRIDDKIPFGIPENWCWCNIKTIAKIINGDRGKSYPSKDKLKANGEYPFVSAINISGGSIRKDNLLYVNKEQYNALHSGKFIRNDILYCIRGSLGKSCISDIDEGAIASSLVIIRPFFQSMLNWLYFVLQTEFIRSQINYYDNGTAQPNLAASNLENFLIPVPPEKERTLILNRLNAIDF